MKDFMLSFVPTVIGFDENNLKERIISIMKFKKPTTLTIALSAFLILGVGTTAAFAVTPKTEETVPNPDPAVLTSEPVNDNTSETIKPETSEPAPVIIETLHNTELIPQLPLKWEDGLETPPEGYYIELQKTDENEEKVMRYFPISETFDSDFAGKYEELLGDDYKMIPVSFGRAHSSSRCYIPKDYQNTEELKTTAIQVTFPPVKVITYKSESEILYPPLSECSFEYHDDGSITVYYYNYRKEPLDFENAKPREPQHYTHQENLGDVILYW